MSEAEMPGVPYMWGDFASAIQEREPRALELAYALALVLPVERGAGTPVYGDTTTGESLSYEISDKVRGVLEEALQKYNALTRGEFALVDLNNPNLFAFERTWQDERLLIVNNLARVPQPIKFGKYSGHEGWDLLNRVEFTFPARAQLEPYEFLWLMPE